MAKELLQFDSKPVRTHWDSEVEEWYFSVVDVVGALTDSVNPTDYLKKLRKRDEQLGAYIGTNCPQVEMLTDTGKSRKTLAATTQQILRIVQSIPSKKAEPFKIWLSEVGNDRINEMQDPEISIDRAIQNYSRLGYSENWINQRIKSIEVRKSLTDEWDKRGVKQGQEYAMLTNMMNKIWSGLSIKEHKELKDLKKENLRDNMTNAELVLNMLAEVSVTDISKETNPDGFAQSAEVAKQGAEIARDARKSLEERTGKPVVSELNAKDLGKRVVESGETNGKK